MNVDLKPRPTGLIMLGLATVILVIAVVIGWGAVQRWRAIAAIDDYHLARLAGQANRARDSADAAAAILPGSAMAALPAIDPAADSAAERLDRLAHDVPTRERAIVATTAAFSAALHGLGSAPLEGADGLLIAHIAALAKGELPPFPTLPNDSIPQAAILSQAAQRHVAAAWKAGKREPLMRGLGLVLLARPTHAEAKTAAVLLAALAPGADRSTITALLSGFGAEGPKLLRRAMLLAPDLTLALTNLIPVDQRTPDEVQRLLANGGDEGEKLDSLVAKGLASPTPGLLANLFRRCLDQDQTALARQIADKASDPQQRELRIALAQHQGDVLALAALQPDRVDLKPTISPPVIGPGRIAFHLATPAGLVPRVGELRVHSDGKPLPPERVKRLGSLVVLLMPNTTGMVDIDVKLGDTTVFAGGVRL